MAEQVAALCVAPTVPMAVSELTVGTVEKAPRYYATLGYGSFAGGKADGGLTTIDEKSLGAYLASRQSVISDLIKPGDIPPKGGLYLMDVVPDGDVRFGSPNINDNVEIVEMMPRKTRLSPANQ